ncbi:MAG: phosphotransferase family protein [Deltaproteobacteria bacterium]|nr:phosphotransferase family protein [Deltaproteobacteria bacterium]
MEKTEIIDSASASIRTGEELDTAKLDRFMKEAVPGLKGELILKQFPAGHSNLTYLLEYGEKEFVLRRPPFGRKAKSAHDMGREYRVLTALKPVFPYCPQTYAYTEDLEIMGCPFYVMERVKGLIIHSELPPGVSYTPEQGRKLLENLADVHIALHNVDYKAVGLEDFGNPTGYVKRQVDGWIDRFRQAKTEDVPDAEDIMKWLVENMPPDSGRASVIHNDYRLDNSVVDADNPLKIIAVLDWEMATIGDPLMDIGNSLTFRMQADDPEEMQGTDILPPGVRLTQSRKEMVDYYSRKSSFSFDSVNYYYCFGLFRLAAIIQQIYYRFYHGQTRDERFAPMSEAVAMLFQKAVRAIEQPEF